MTSETIPLRYVPRSGYPYEMTLPWAIWYVVSPVLWCLAVYILHALGVLSLFFGLSAALTVALCLRFAVAYTAAYHAHAAGACGGGAILVGGDAGAAPALALALTALVLAAWSGCFVSGNLCLGTRFPALARLVFAASLACCMALFALGTTPYEELLESYWSAQRLVNYWRTLTLSTTKADVLLQDAQRVLGDAPRAVRDALFPSPLLTSAWALLHPRCHASFVLAARAALALLALPFLTTLACGLCLRRASRKAHAA